MNGENHNEQERSDEPYDAAQAQEQESVIKTNQSFSFAKPAAIFIFVIVVMLGAWYVYVTTTLFSDEDQSLLETYDGTNDPSMLTEQQKVTFSKSVVQDVRDGNFAQSARRAASIASESNDPTFNASLAWNSAGSKFKATGDISGTLEDIRVLQESAQSSEIPPVLRAKILNTLASSYCGSGRNPLVFEALYEGSYAGYKAEDDPLLSSRYLHEAAHQVFPTAHSAIRIARWYAQVLLEVDGRDLSDEEISTYTEKLKDYIQAASNLSDAELAAVGEEYLDSKSYASYLYWRAFAIGALASTVGEPYASQYESAFDEVLENINRNNQITYQYLPFTEWLYAAALNAQGVSDARVREHLANVVELVKADPNGELNEFVIFVKQTPKEGDALIPTFDYFSSQIFDMMDVSPTFKNFVLSINPELE